MKASSVLSAATLLAVRAAAQSNPALGKSITIDFTSGASSSFSPAGNPSYDSQGAAFTVAKSGDNPQLVSNWYLMFGRVEVVVKAAPGVGIVSSAILQSDVKDEIDWEWLGASPDQVQTNYFGKGQTTTYDRGAFHAAPGSQANFKTYTIDWTADQISWSIDGAVVRTLLPANAKGQYPQTPMQVKLGSWSGGDSSNQPGTIEWAGGPTNYAAGPYTFHVKSVKVTDYSTGKSYNYGGGDGSWKSITSDGGSIGSSGSASGNAKPAPIDSAATSVTSTASGQPIPFPAEATQSVSRPSTYPWVPSATKTGDSSVATNQAGSGMVYSTSGTMVYSYPGATPSASGVAGQAGSGGSGNSTTPVGNSANRAGSVPVLSFGAALLSLGAALFV